MTANRQLVINMISGFVAYFMSLCISFFLSPYIVDKVGVEAYGFIGLANNFISYAGLLTIALNSLAGRFVTIKLYEKDYKGANKYFSSVFYANMIIGAILFIAAAVIWIYLENIIQIPTNIYWDVKILFASLFLNCIMGTIGSVFSISTFATNKLYLASLRQIESTLIRTVLVILMFIVLPTKVCYMGITLFVAGIYSLIFNIYYTKILVPDLKINPKSFDIKSIVTLISSGIWNLINRLGTLLLEGVDLLISNIFINPTAMGIISLSKLIPTAISGVIGTLAGVFSPDFTILYAQKKKKELIDEVKRSMKIMGFISNIPIILLIVCGDKFFALWQPTQNAAQLHILSIITCATFIVNGSVNCIFNIFTVVNKLRFNSIMIILSGIINIVVVYILLATTNLGIYAVAGVSTVISIIRNLALTIPYGAKCLEQKWYIFYSEVLRSFVFVVAGTIIGYMIKLNFAVNSWTSLVVCAVLVCMSTVCIGMFTMLNKQERRRIMGAIINKAKSVYCILYGGIVKIRARFQNNVRTAQCKEKIKQLHNKHNGERCFIIGSGPSLLVEDLEKLKKEICFASHRIYSIYNRTSWRPQYYCAQDCALINKSAKVIGELVQSDWKLIAASKNAPCKKVKDACYLNIIEEEFYPDYPKFAEEISEGFYEGMTVTYMCIQVAVYMGFKEIYLLGVDHNYSATRTADGKIEKDDSIKNYFSSDYSLDAIPQLYKSTKAYEGARKYAQEHGIKIYNATRGGKLEAFERVNFDDIIKEEQSK